jgi:hypothetical protein
MNRRLSFLIEQSSSAPRTVVYGVLEDVARWPLWMPGVQVATWEQQGADTATGQGAIRAMTARGITAREQIIVAEHPSHQAYIMLSGLPVKDYRADVRIDDRGTGCVITWSATFAPKLPATGHLIRFAMQASIAKVAAALAREAERTHGIAV